MNVGKLGVVSQEFTDGSFAVWCEADKLLYHYHLDQGQGTQASGTKLQFWHNDGEHRITRYELSTPTTAVS